MTVVATIGNLFASVDDMFNEKDELKRHQIPISSDELESLVKFVEGTKFYTAASHPEWKHKTDTPTFNYINRTDDVTGVLQSRSWIKIPNVPPQVIFHLLHNTSARLSFDKYYVRFDVSRHVDENLDVLVSEIDGPLGITNREFIEWRRTSRPLNPSDRNYYSDKYVIYLRSCEESACSESVRPNPNRKKVERAEVWMSGYVITWWVEKASSESSTDLRVLGSELLVLSHVDSRGSIPRFAMNAAGSVGPAKWANTINEAAIELCKRKKILDIGNMTNDDIEKLLMGEDNSNSFYLGSTPLINLNSSSELRLGGCGHSNNSESEDAGVDVEVFDDERNGTAVNRTTKVKNIVPYRGGDLVMSMINDVEEGLSRDYCAMETASTKASSGVVYRGHQDNSDNGSSSSMLCRDISCNTTETGTTVSPFEPTIDGGSDCLKCLNSTDNLDQFTTLTDYSVTDRGNGQEVAIEEITSTDNVVDNATANVPAGWKYFLQSGQLIGVSLMAFCLTLCIWNSWRAVTYVFSPLPGLFHMRMILNGSLLVVAVIGGILVFPKKTSKSFHVICNILAGIALWELIESSIVYLANLDPMVELIVYTSWLLVCIILVVLLYKFKDINVVDTSLMSPV